MRPFGRVALLGCTRDKNFTIDYYRKVHGPGISLIGAHTNARPHTESSPHAFTQRDDMQTLLTLIGLGRIDPTAMVDAVYSPEECTRIYDGLVHDPNFPVVVQYDWSKLK